MASVEDRLTQLIAPVVESLGYELLLLEYSPHRGSALVRLFIDAAAGIGLDDCERVSKEVSGVLDVEDPIPQAYRLEVSSPGFDRPLVKPEHFERFAGEEAHVQMLTPSPRGQRKFQGRIAGLQNKNVLLDTPEGRVELSITDIERARLVPRYDAQPARSQRQ